MARLRFSYRVARRPAVLAIFNHPPMCAHSLADSARNTPNASWLTGFCSADIHITRSSRRWKDARGYVTAQYS